MFLVGKTHIFLFSWAAAKAAKLAGPVAHGTKDVPDGAPDCLAGLAFVFAGELSSFSRDEAIDLAKRFGGSVNPRANLLLIFEGF